MVDKSRRQPDFQDEEVSQVVWEIKGHLLTSSLLVTSSEVCGKKAPVTENIWGPHTSLQAQSLCSVLLLYIRSAQPTHPQSAWQCPTLLGGPRCTMGSGTEPLGAGETLYPPLDGTVP